MIAAPEFDTAAFTGLTDRGKLRVARLQAKANGHSMTFWQRGSCWCVNCRALLERDDALQLPRRTRSIWKPCPFAIEETTP